VSFYFLKALNEDDASHPFFPLKTKTHKNYKLQFPAETVQNTSKIPFRTHQMMIYWFITLIITLFNRGKQEVHTDKQTKKVYLLESNQLDLLRQCSLIKYARIKKSNCYPRNEDDFDIQASDEEVDVDFNYEGKEPSLTPRLLTYL